MTNLTRRHALVGSLGAATSLSFASLPARAASHAAAENAALPPRPVFNQGKLGAFTLMTVLDGATSGFGKTYEIFGTEQPPEEVEAFAVENFLPPETLEIGFTPTIVDTGSARILFDTGLGGENGRLAERMTAAGVDPASITHVVITHMHPDHVGGLMTGGEPTFPQAEYIAGETEFQHWTSGDAVADHVTANVMPLADRFRLIRPGDDVVTGITAVEAFGHTPGHLAFNVESDGDRVVITADAANHYVLSLQKPDWQVRFDMDKAAAAETRRELFGMIAADKVPFIGYHMPFPSIGYVEPKDDGFRYVAASYQFYVE